MSFAEASSSGMALVFLFVCAAVTAMNALSTQLPLKQQPRSALGSSSSNRRMWMFRSSLASTVALWVCATVARMAAR